MANEISSIPIFDVVKRRRVPAIVGIDRLGLAGWTLRIFRCYERG